MRSAGQSSINVKQAVAAPVFTKHFRKQVEDLLKMGPVPGLLKDTGFDPLKDIDRFTLVMGRSCYVPEGDLKADSPFPESHPVVIVQGNLDVAKVKALAEHAAKAGGVACFVGGRPGKGARTAARLFRFGGR